MATIIDSPVTDPQQEEARRESHYALRRRTLDRIRSSVRRRRA